MPKKHDSKRNEILGGFKTQTYLLATEKWSKEQQRNKEKEIGGKSCEKAKS
jgi:hypothetical protein